MRESKKSCGIKSLHCRRRHRQRELQKDKKEKKFKQNYLMINDPQSKRKFLSFSLKHRRRLYILLFIRNCTTFLLWVFYC